MINKATLGRDILAAIGEAVTTSLDPKYSVHLEGQTRTKGGGCLEGIEMRVDGPSITEPSKGTLHAVVEIDLLVTLRAEGNIYDMPLALGDCVVALESGIPVIDLDTKEHIGCLTTYATRRGADHIRVSNFGQIDGDVPALQGSVATDYILKT